MSAAQAKKWVAMARKSARGRAGDGWDLLGDDLRHALVCERLVAILAGQEIANGETMRAACEIVVTECAAMIGDRFLQQRKR